MCLLGRAINYILNINQTHYDVIKWKLFPCYWPFVRGINWSAVDSPHKGQWRGALMVLFICVWEKRLSKQSRRRWLETPSRSLWRHCHATYIPPMPQWLRIQQKRTCVPLSLNNQRRFTIYKTRRGNDCIHLESTSGIFIYHMSGMWPPTDSPEDWYFAKYGSYGSNTSHLICIFMDFLEFSGSIGYGE